MTHDIESGLTEELSYTETIMIRDAASRIDLSNIADSARMVEEPSCIESIMIRHEASRVDLSSSPYIAESARMVEEPSYIETIMTRYAASRIDLASSPYIAESARMVVNRLETVAIPYALENWMEQRSEHENDARQPAGYDYSGGTGDVWWTVGNRYKDRANIMTVYMEVRDRYEIDIDDAIHDVTHQVILLATEMIREKNGVIGCTHETNKSKYRIKIVFPLTGPYRIDKQEAGCIIQ